MPIKFRCTHCRQFLGISRSKAGEVVDCPTCGRTLRVPNLDGKVLPLPQPKLNLKDSSLAGALGELARIGEEPEDERERRDEPAIAPGPAPRSVKTVRPAPAPEPISLDPLPPAQPVPKPQSGPRPARPSPAATTPAGESPLGELAAIAPREDARDHRSVWGRSRRSRLAALFPIPVLLTLAGTGALAFAVGYLSGRSLGSGEAGTIDRADRANGGVAGEDGAGLQAALERQAALRGQITYETSDGRSSPDAGARIMVFPETRPDGEARLSVAGFRAGDRQADVHLAVASLRALGGDLAIADEDGQYETSLPRQGEYRVVVVSRYQSHGEEEPIDSTLQRLLEDYFEHPDALLGRRSRLHDRVRYTGERPETRNYTFERPI